MFDGCRAPELQLLLIKATDQLVFIDRFVALRRYSLILNNYNGSCRPYTTVINADNNITGTTLKNTFI